VGHLKGIEGTDKDADPDFPPGKNMTMGHGYAGKGGWGGLGGGVFRPGPEMILRAGKKGLYLVFCPRLNVPFLDPLVDPSAGGDKMAAKMPKFLSILGP
jgi:hypothetical protein